MRVCVYIYMYIDTQSVFWVHWPVSCYLRLWLMSLPLAGSMIVMRVSCQVLLLSDFWVYVGNRNLESQKYLKGSFHDEYIKLFLCRAFSCCISRASKSIVIVVYRSYSQLSIV